MKPTLIAMTGLPRSGKSTIVEDLRVRLAAPVVRRDAIRLAVHGQRYAAAAEPLIKSIDIYMVRALFLAGHPIVICDETNYSRAARDHMRDERWDTIFYPVPTDLDTCVKRAIATNQLDLIPVIQQMHDRWEEFLPTDRILTDITEAGTIVDRQFA